MPQWAPPKSQADRCPKALQYMLAIPTHTVLSMVRQSAKIDAPWRRLLFRRSGRSEISGCELGPLQIPVGIHPQHESSPRTIASKTDQNPAPNTRPTASN